MATGKYIVKTRHEIVKKEFTILAAPENKE